MLSAVTGLAVQRNKAIVGETHSPTSRESTRRNVKERSTYEIMRPEDVGVPQPTWFSASSGRHALGDRVNEMGYTLTDEMFEMSSTTSRPLPTRRRKSTTRTWSC